MPPGACLAALEACTRMDTALPAVRDCLRLALAGTEGEPAALPRDQRYFAALVRTYVALEDGNRARAAVAAAEAAGVALEADVLGSALGGESHP